MSLFAVDPSYGDCGNGNGDGSCSRTTGGGVSKNFLAAAAVAEALAAVEHLHNQQQQKQEQLNHKTHTTLSSSSIPMDSTSSEFNLPIMSATVNDHTPGVDMADWLNLLSNNIITNNSKQDSENSQEFYLNEISYSSESKSHFVNDINIGGHFQNINHQLLPQQQNHSPSNEFKNSVAPAAEQTTDVVSQSQQLATALIDFFGDNRPLNSFKKTSTPDKTEIKKSGGKKTGSCSSSSSSSSRNSVQSAVKPAKVKSKLNTCSNNNNNVGSTKANQSRKQKQRQIIQESSAQHERISSSQESVVVSPLLLNHGTGQVHFDAHLLNETSTLESSPLVRDYQSQEQLQQQWQWQNFISSDNNNNTNNNNNNNNNSGTGNNMLFELPMNSIAAIQQPAEANQLPMSSNFQMQRESASDDFTQQPDFLALCKWE